MSQLRLIGAFGESRIGNTLVSDDWLTTGPDWKRLPRVVASRDQLEAIETHFGHRCLGPCLYIP
jgi:hypothetical protein